MGPCKPQKLSLSTWTSVGLGLGRRIGGRKGSGSICCSTRATREPRLVRGGGALEHQRRQGGEGGLGGFLIAAMLHCRRRRLLLPHGPAQRAQGEHAAQRAAVAMDVV